MEKENEKIWVPVIDKRAETKEGLHETNVIAWSPGEIISDAPDKNGCVTVRHGQSGEEINIASDRLQKQNDASLFEGKELKNIDDLITLKFLHEPAILKSLTVRYDNHLIYTATGPILIAINPFKHLPLYTWPVLKHFKESGDRQRQGELQSTSPHVYKLSGEAYRAMKSAVEDNLSASSNKSNNSSRAKEKLCNQSILISGESGAGKTVSTKYCMTYLACMGLAEKDAKITASLGTSSQSLIKSTDTKTNEEKMSTTNASANSKSSEIQAKVLVSNAILEAFGNARTLRNDNSSRFGKYIQMAFDSRGRLAGATISTYLLEKSRLVFQNPNERNYHIFYQLLEGATDSERDELQLINLEDCVYTNHSGCYKREDGVSDAEEWHSLRRAMYTLGLSEEEQHETFTLLSCIMHLSLIQFESTHVRGGGEGSCFSINTMTSSTTAAALLMVEMELFEKGLCKSRIFVDGVFIETEVPLNRAVTARDSLAKLLYERLFLWLVSRINDAISINTDEETKSSISNNKSSAYSYIGILDIFGFEDFYPQSKNTFEQLCVNYANEKLQHQFNQFMFQVQQDEYEKEKIKWEGFVEFADNSGVIKMINDIFNTLNDACQRSGRKDGAREDESFANILYGEFRKKKWPQFLLGKRRAGKYMFAVNHYAGQVDYTTKGFVKKNKDSLPDCVLDMVKSAGLSVTNAIFEERKSSRVTSSSPGRRRKNTVKQMTVCGGFKDQLQSLMKTISTTRPWYIRCIKPNDKHVPDELDPVRTLQQLRYGGVLEAVRVSRAGYPCRVEHKDFVNKFNSLVNKSDMINLNIREKCQYIIDTAQLPERDCQVGLSKIFLRQDAYDKIEAKRWKRLKIAATICQRRFRGYKHRKVHKRRIATLYRAVIMIKMWIRMRKLKHIRKKAAFRTIVRFYTKNVKAFVKRAQAAVAIQCLARKILSINARDVKIAERIQAKEDLKLSNQIKRLKIELENARSVIQQMNSKRESVNNSISESEDMSDGNNGSRIVDKGSTTSNSDRVEVFSTKHFENDTRSSHNTMTDKIDPNLLAERDELILKNATLLEANNSLTLQLEKLSETNTTLSNSNEKLRKELLANSSSLLVEELESAVAAAKAATSQAKKISEINVQLRNELGASVAANTGLRLQLESGLSKATPKNPSRERVRSTSIESHARRYSPKQLKDENASIQDQLIKEDLLHANEFLAIANRDLMIKNENYGKYIIDLERAIGSGEVNLLLEDGTEIEPAQLAQENIMLKKRVEMQAKINTTLSIECEQLKKDYAISKKQLEAVRDIMTPRKKQ